MFVSLFILALVIDLKGSPQTEVSSDFVQTQDFDFVDLPKVELEENSEFDLSAYRSVRIRKLISAPGAKIYIADTNSGANGDFSLDGADAQDALFFIDSVEGDIIFEARGGDGGDGRDGRNGRQGIGGSKGRDAVRLLWFFLGNGKDGYSGQAGEDGEDGEDGGSGGNGAHVQIFYKKKPDSSHIYVDVAGGAAGKAGRAGRGGLGGPGGPGGRGIKPGRQGNMGSSGKDGLPGRPGIPGKPGKVSVYQVKPMLYQCLVEFHLLNINEEEWQECIDRSSRESI